MAAVAYSLGIMGEIIKEVPGSFELCLVKFDTFLFLLKQLQSLSTLFAK
jgi:hypothetical protein